MEEKLRDNLATLSRVEKRNIIKEYKSLQEEICDIKEYQMKRNNEHGPFQENVGQNIESFLHLQREIKKATKECSERLKLFPHEQA